MHRTQFQKRLAVTHRSPLARFPRSRLECGMVKAAPVTADEQTIARASKISDVEYARHKLRMEREKASGERQT